MTKTATESTLISNVMIDGNVVPLDGEFTVAQAKEMLMESGIMTNIGNASAIMVTPDTIEFSNARGDNGVQ